MPHCESNSIDRRKSSIATAKETKNKYLQENNGEERKEVEYLDNQLRAQLFDCDVNEKSHIATSKLGPRWIFLCIKVSFKAASA